MLNAGNLSLLHRSRPVLFKPALRLGGCLRSLMQIAADLYVSGKRLFRKRLCRLSNLLLFRPPFATLCTTRVLFRFHLIAQATLPITQMLHVGQQIFHTR